MLQQRVLSLQDRADGLEAQLTEEREKYLEERITSAKNKILLEDQLSEADRALKILQEKCDRMSLHKTEVHKDTETHIAELGHMLKAAVQAQQDIQDRLETVQEEYEREHSACVSEKNARLLLQSSLEVIEKERLSDAQRRDKELMSAKMEIDDKTSQIESLDAQKQMFIKQLEEKTSEHATLNKQLMFLKSQFEEKSAEFASMEIQHKKLINELGQHESLNMELSAMRKNLEEHVSQIESLESQKQTLIRQLEVQLKSEESQQKLYVNEQQAVINDRDALVTSLSAAKLELEEKFLKLESHEQALIQQLEQKVSALEIVENEKGVLISENSIKDR